MATEPREASWSAVALHRSERATKLNAKSLTPRRRERWPSAKTLASALKYAGLKSTPAGATPKPPTGTSRHSFELVGDDVRRLKYSAPSFRLEPRHLVSYKIEGIRAERELSQLAAGGMTRDGWNVFKAGWSVGVCGLGQSVPRCRLQRPLRLCALASLR